MLGDGQKWFGIMLIAASGVAFSTAGLFTRMIALDVWTVLFWRGMFGGAFIAGYIVWLHRGRTLAAIKGIGSVGLLAALCSTASTICFINALRQTTVADVAVINAAAPLATAALAWWWTSERERWTTLAASIVAVFGVAVMTSAARADGHLIGEALALAMTIGIAAMMVIIRRGGGTPMLPAASLSAFASAIVVLPLAHPAAVSFHDLIELFLFGTTQFGLGLLLLTVGMRLVSATQSALIGNLEVSLAPVWVWLAFGEIPSLMTSVGGAIVLTAVLADTLLRGRTGEHGSTDTSTGAAYVVVRARPAWSRGWHARLCAGRSDSRAGAGARPDPAASR